MIISNGYTIEQYPKQNMIVIGLPQTMITATSSVGHIVNRKTELSDDELTILLAAVKLLFQNIGEEQ